jgi:hypothetical protein
MTWASLMFHHPENQEYCEHSVDEDGQRDMISQWYHQVRKALPYEETKPCEFVS